MNNNSLTCTYNGPSTIVKIVSYDELNEHANILSSYHVFNEEIEPNKTYKLTFTINDVNDIPPADFGKLCE